MATVRVGGTQLTRVADLEWSTKVDLDTRVGGCWSASCTLDRDPRYSADFLRRGQTFEVFEGSSVPVWSGVLTEPERGAPWRLSAEGLGRRAERYLAVSGTEPTASPSAALAQAVADGIGWVDYPTDLPSVANSEDGPNYLDVMLGVSASSTGSRLAVFADRRLVKVAGLAGSPSWVVPRPGVLLPTADDEYVTHLYARYATAVDSSGVPTAFATVAASDASAAARYGRTAAWLDLTGLGLLLEAQAQARVDGRFQLVGARTAYTSGVDLRAGELQTGGGVSASAGRVRAGQTVRVYGAMDSDGKLNRNRATDILIGETRYRDDDRSLSLLPVGMAARDFRSALEKAQAPKQADELVA